MGVGYSNLLEEDLVEVGAAGHLPQRPHLHPRSLHVHDETREALVLGEVGVGPADHLADVGVVSTRCPHLLPGDDPLVTVGLGSHLQTGQVGSGAGLGEQLTADDVASIHLGQDLGGHVVFGVIEDRGCDHPEPDPEEALVRHVVTRLEVTPRLLVGAGQSPTAQLGGAGDPPEPGVVLLGPPLLSRGQLHPLLAPVDLLEQRRIVWPFTPHEGGGLGLEGGVGVEERRRLIAELFDGDVGHARQRTAADHHRRSPAQPVRFCFFWFFVWLAARFWMLAHSSRSPTVRWNTAGSSRSAAK